MVSIEYEWVEFTFYRPGAVDVCVAGDFNGWKTGDLTMISSGDGNWAVRIPLPPGEFRFRYCADGEWFADYAACGVEPGRFGMDSIVIVSRQTAKTKRPRKVRGVRKGIEEVVIG